MNNKKKIYKQWKVDGLVATMHPQPREGLIPKKFVVRYTSDKIGKSLSIADEVSGVMFQIPFDWIEKEIVEGGKR